MLCCSPSASGSSCGHRRIARSPSSAPQLGGELAATRARLEAELAAERRASTEKLALLRDAEEKLREAFSALSSDALRKNNQSFLDLAKASLTEFQQTARMDLDGRQKAIEDLVQPLKDSLTKVDGKLQEVEKNRVGTASALTEQLRSLHVAQQSLQVETGRLVQALRSPNVRGQWGELQLRRVVEAAGMLEDRDFDLKESVDADGTRLTPDMIVRLPGGRNVVVDAKVALVGVPRCDGIRRRGGAQREAARPRAAGARSRRPPREQDLLAAFPAGAGPRRSCSCRARCC